MYKIQNICFLVACYIHIQTQAAFINYGRELNSQLDVDQSSGKLYTSLAQEGAGSYALSVKFPNFSSPFGLLTRQATVDSHIKQDNPIYNESITSFTLTKLANSSEQKAAPTAAISSKLNTIYSVLNNPILSGTDSEIISYTYPDEITEIIQLDSGQNMLWAASKDSGTNFLEPSSNSQFSLFHFIPKIHTSTMQIGSTSIPQKSVTYAIEKQVTLDIDNTSPLFLFNQTSPQPTATSSVALKPHPTAPVLYQGYELLGPGKALLINRRAALDTVTLQDFDTNNYIVASRFSFPTIKHITFMQTTTNLNYLAVVDGTENTVYALPIINDGSSTNYGHIAKKGASPQAIYNKNGAFLTLWLSDAPENTSDLYTSNDQAVRVGVESLGSSYTIKKIKAYKDTIVVYAQNNDGSGASGLFYSQAIFNQNGTIAGWTAWQRKGYLGEYNAFELDLTTGSFFGIPKVIPNTVQQSTWQFLPALTKSDTLPSKQSGTQAIVDIPKSHPALDQTSKPSYVVFLGNETVEIHETSESNDLLPYSGSTKPAFETFIGALTSFDTNTEYGSVLCTGGNLKNSGALVTGTLGYTSTNNAWFIIGGSGGIFILKNQNGTGIIGGSLNKGFGGFQSSMEWSQFTNITNVKKIICDSDFLYALTTSDIYRIPLTTDNIVKGTSAQKISIAHNEGFQDLYLNNVFSDMLISEKLIIIASSNGLYRNSNDTDVKTISSLSLSNYTKINLPENVRGPVCMQAITPLNLPTDISKTPSLGFNLSNTTGNVYILSSNISERQSRLYRLAIQSTSSQNISDNTVQLFSDHFSKDTPQTYFYAPKAERFSLLTDGALTMLYYIMFSSLAKRGTIELLPQDIRAGLITLSKVPLSMAVNNPVNTTLGQPAYISGYGQFALPASNGLYILR